MTPTRDQGLSTLLVVLMAPLILALGALVFDGGRGYVARRETQNAADAAALAKATDCARNISVTNLSAYQTNGATLTNTPTCGSGVTTAQMSKTINYSFAPGGGSGTVTRTGIARWSALTSARGVFPITIASCALSGVSFGTTVTFRARAFPGSPCPSPAGQFGWTDINCSSPTAVTVGTGFGINGLPGNTPRACTNAQLNSFIGQEVLVPVWDQSVSCGFTYCLTTFAMFRLTGWSANGNNFGASPSTLQRQCDASRDGGINHAENTPCIRGYFIRYTTQTGSYGPGACNTATVVFGCRVYLSAS